MLQSPLRFVVDTNLFVSFVAFKSPDIVRCFDVLEARGIFLYSDETLLELEQVLHRPKLLKHSTSADRISLLTNLRRLGERVVITETLSVRRDPKDDKFLALAIAGRADYLVTGDADLLSLGSFRGIPIIRISDVLALAL